MRTKDLMIGDWVLNNGKPIQVYSVFNSSINETYYSVSNEVAGYILESEIEPIPLTTEILEKNGFVKVPDRYEYPDCQCWTNDVDGDYGFEIVADEHRKPHILGNREMGDYELVNFECKFVHELQHILRILGIDKEIKL